MSRVVWGVSRPTVKSRYFKPASQMSGKQRVLKTVTIAQEETILNIIWNGSMFDGLDWPLNASRGFVRISWASCCIYYKLEADTSLHLSVNFVLGTWCIWMSLDRQSTWWTDDHLKLSTFPSTGAGASAVNSWFRARGSKSRH